MWLQLIKSKASIFGNSYTAFTSKKLQRRRICGKLATEIQMHNIKCPQWRELVANETGLEYFKHITSELEDISNSGVAVYPSPEQRFKALELTTFADTKVVILGQDPYHGPGQAHGLAFSVPNGLTKPPSLRNIHKELCSDLGINPPKHGDLSSWAKQGVLLLNSSLSVISGQAGSHSKLGWHTFTDQIIRHLNNRRQAIVFMLWGKHAMAKSDLDRKSVV